MDIASIERQPPADRPMISSVLEQLGQRLPISWRGSLYQPYRVIIGAVGVGILLTFGLLMVHYTTTLNHIEQIQSQVQTLTRLIDTVHTARAAATHFLITSDPNDFAASTEALTQLSQTIDQTLPMMEVSTQLSLETLSGLNQDYLNTSRSLGTLILSGTSSSAEASLRQAADSAGEQLDSYADTLLRQEMASLGNTLHFADDQNSRWQIGIFLLILVICAAGFFMVMQVTRDTIAALATIGQAAEAVAVGDFAAQATVKRHDELGRLALVFNQMIDALRTARQTEAATNDQQRRQMMTLARQERMAAILEERQRIARDLHDSVKQQLFSLTMAAGAALNLLNKEPEMARTYLEHVRQSGANAQSEMTQLLQEMSLFPLHEHHVDEALLQYLTPLCEVHKLKLLWRVEGTNTLTIAQEHTIFRIAQEATANVIRHSGATLLRITLSFGLQTVLVVEDNGQGFDPEHISPTSTGLAMMRLRLKQVGGTLRLHSTPGKGTRLEVTLDLRKKGAL